MLRMRFVNGWNAASKRCPDSFGPPLKAHVVLREEKFRQIAEIAVKAAGEGAYVASAEAEDIRTAIDLVMHKIESAVRRAHDRRVDHRRHQVDADEQAAL